MWRVRQAAEQEVGTAWNSFVAVVYGFLYNRKSEHYEQLVQTLVKNYAKMGCRMSMTLFLTNSRRTWELSQRSKVNTFIKIYWTLNIVTKDSIWKTWWGTTFGGFFGKALCSTLANLEELLILNLFFSDFWLSLSTYHASVVFYLTAWTKM